MKLRLSSNGKLLLGGQRAGSNRGRLLLADVQCVTGHILVRTDGKQHPSCVELQLSNGRAFTRKLLPSSSNFSLCYDVAQGSGSFDVSLRWNGGHSPYPKIQDMEVWCFGIYLGNTSYPKAPDGYQHVAHITIDTNGYIYVNGEGAGYWSEFSSEH